MKSKACICGLLSLILLFSAGDVLYAQDLIDLLAWLNSGLLEQAIVAEILP